MSFIERSISATITLANGSFSGTSEQNTVTLTDYRMSASILKAGGDSQGELNIRIYGLGLSLMNKLSTLGKTPVIIDTRNKISIAAGDSINGISVVFVGNIYQAYTDLNGAPDAIFHICAYAGLGESIQTAPPSSFSGATNVATVLSGLATQAGLLFENNGVSVILNTPYFPGSVRSQIQACCNHANINWIIDNGKLAIWPQQGSRNGSIPLISPQTGMIGYPFPSGQGLLGLKTIFNPQITFGGQIQVQSSIAPAVGKWTICHVEHDIECQFPGGNWLTTLQGTPPGYLSTQG
jgi:hypothetical protein